MRVDNKIHEMQERLIAIRQGGGTDKINQQHKEGKLTARERIDKLVDAGSFVEIDAFLKHRAVDFNMSEVNAPGDGLVAGYATIDGRPIYLYAQDYTVIGGSLGEMHAKKITKVQDMAMKMGCPLIAIIDSSGARIQEGLDALAGYGDIFYRNTLASGVIPQISVVSGPCAGSAVNSPALSDFVFMTENISQMFVTGPQVIEAVTGDLVSIDELGGVQIHNETTGLAHFVSETEEDTFANIKKLLSFLPQNNLEDSPIYDNSDDLNRLSPDLNSIIPVEANKSYDVLDIINDIVDNGDFLEIQPLYANNIVVGFARINGKSIGIIANQAKIYAGCLDINALNKAAKFIRFCDSFNIPLVTLTDVPGYLPSIDQEHGGLARHSAKLMYAYSEATVPKINVILRKAYGGAYLAMSSKSLGTDMVFSWPTAEISVMEPDAAANILFKNDIENSNDPINTRNEKIEEYKNIYANPYIAAEKGHIDDIIEPEATRSRIASALEILDGKRESRPPKKHGNIPL